MKTHGVADAASEQGQILMIETAINDLMALLPIEGAPSKEAAVAAEIRKRLIPNVFPRAY